MENKKSRPLSAALAPALVAGLAAWFAAQTAFAQYPVQYAPLPPAGSTFGNLAPATTAQPNQQTQAVPATAFHQAPASNFAMPTPVQQSGVVYLDDADPFGPTPASYNALGAGYAVGDSGYCGDAYCGCGADCSCGDFCSSCMTGCCTPRSFVFLEYHYLQVDDVDVAHAQQQNGIGGAGTVPFGDINSAELEFNPGARLGGGVCLDACSSLIASFAYYEGDAFAQVGPPVVVGGGGAVGSLVHHPGAQITASVGPVTADYEIKYRLVDVAYRRAWKCTSCSEINWLLGFQYGHLDQDFNQFGDFAGGSAGTLNTSTTIDFDGGGVKAGVDGERYMGLGLSAYGRLVAAAMSGQFNSRYTMYNMTTDELLAQANWKDDRVIGQIEYEVGLAWTSCSRRIQARAGYMFSHWTNAVTTPEFIDAVQADNYTDVGDTITFDGFVMRGEFRW